MTANAEVDAIRAELCAAICVTVGDRPALEARYGQVWDVGELTHAFEVQWFMAPFVVVRRRSDGLVGSLMFQPTPRFYFGFETDNR